MKEGHYTMATLTNEAALTRMENYSKKISSKSLTTDERKVIYERMKVLYAAYDCVRAVWEWVETATRYAFKFVKKASFYAITTLHPNIEWNDIKPIEVPKKEKREQLYLIRMLDEDNNLVYSKVGTTTRSTKERMKEHLKYYYDNGVRKIVVDRLWECGNMPAEGLESQFRALYIQRFPNSFRKNDRFINVEFDLEEADRIVKNFLHPESR